MYRELPMFYYLTNIEALSYIATANMKIHKEVVDID